MKDFFFLNGFSFNKGTDFFLTKNKIYGWGDYTFNLVYTRFEKFFNKNNNIISFKETEWNKFKSILYSFFPKTREIKNKYIINIFLLDFLHTYRGLRHSRGLPVRGQRTWTNAWSTYRSNMTLRSFKLELAKRIYGNLASNSINTLYLAEQVNYIWKLQWKKEWLQARNKRLKLTFKDYNNIFKIDLNSMSKGHVDGFDKKSNASKKKTQMKKNTFTLGFEPNFVLYYLNLSNSTSKDKNKFQLLFTEESQKTKLVQKKKANVKKINVKKSNVKKKNNNWD